MRVIELKSPTNDSRATRGFGLTDVDAAHGVLAVGQLVADVTIGEDQFDINHAALWVFVGSPFGFMPGPHDLTAEAGWTDAGRANDINLAGLVVGSQIVEISEASKERPFVWDLDLEDYFPLGVFVVEDIAGDGGSAESVNDLYPATVVGGTGYPASCVSLPIQRGFVWQQDGDPDDLTQMVPLTGAPGNDQSCAFGIAQSSTALVVGDSQGCGTVQLCQPNDDATWWTIAGSPTELEPLPGDNQIRGRGVNDSATIAGWGRVEEEEEVECKRHAVVWESEEDEPFDLHDGADPPLSALSESSAEAINNEDGNGRRQIVGADLTSLHAMLWESEEPEVWCSVDLNDLMAARQAARWILRSANDINNSGIVVGEGLFDAGASVPWERGFLLTCGADLNGDGVINGGDSGTVLSNWECEEPSATSLTCPGDYNFDGVVDGADLGEVLSLWGACSLRQLCPETESALMSSQSEVESGEAASLFLTVLQSLGFGSMEAFASWANEASASQRASVVATIEVMLSS